MTCDVVRFIKIHPDVGRLGGDCGSAGDLLSAGGPPRERRLHVPVVPLTALEAHLEDRGEQVGDKSGVAERVEPEQGLESIVHRAIGDGVLPVLRHLEPVDDRHPDTGTVPVDESLVAFGRLASRHDEAGQVATLFSVMLHETNECVLHVFPPVYVAELRLINITDHTSPVKPTRDEKIEKSPKFKEKNQ